MKSGNWADDSLSPRPDPAPLASDTGLVSDLCAGSVALLQGVANEFAIDGHASAATDAKAYHAFESANVIPLQALTASSRAYTHGLTGTPWKAITFNRTVEGDVWDQERVSCNDAIEGRWNSG